MDQQIKDNLFTLLSIVGAVGAWPVFKGWFLNVMSWNNKRKLSKLKRELELMVSLNNSDRDLLIFVSTAVLTIAALLGASLFFRYINILPNSNKYSILIDWIIGISIYILSAYRLGQLVRLKKFDKTVEHLESEIRKIETKTVNNSDVIDGGTF